MKLGIGSWHGRPARDVITERGISIPRKAAVWLIALSLATAAAAELLPIPEPSLAGMEAAVREQLGEGLARLRALAATDGVAEVDLAEAYGDLGRVYLAYDLVAPAEACLKNAHTLSPGDFRWAYLLGALYQNERRLDEALEAYEAALALEPKDLPALIRSGNLHLARDEPEQARAYFGQALALEGRQAAALAGLGKAAAALGDFSSAVRRFEAALAEQPEATALHYPLAIAYRELGRIDDARRHLALRGDVEAPFPDPLAQGLLELATGAGVHLMFGHRAMRQGNVDAAVERFRRAVAANPRSAPAQQALGAALARQGDAEGAIAHYSASLALEPENPTLHYNLGTVLVERGEDGQAIRHFEAALELAPDYHNARYNLATALGRAGRHAEAETHYRTLLEADPGDHGTRFYLARTLLQAGRHAEAAALFAALLDEDPSRRRALGGLAEALARGGRYPEAAARYGELVESEPADEGARFGQAMALILAERYGEARARLEEGLAALPDSAHLAHALARLLAACPSPEVRDGERALELARALFQSAQNPLYAETVAMAYAELGRFDDALAWQRRLILEARRASGGAALLPRLERRLALYQRGEPCRAPWLEERASGSDP